MPALHRGFRRGGIGASDGHGVSHVLPISGSKVSTAEAEPLVTVRLNQSKGFFVGPAGRREAARRSRGGRGRESKRSRGLIAGGRGGGDGSGGGGGRGRERRRGHEKLGLGLGRKRGEGEKAGGQWVEVVGRIINIFVG